MNGSSATIAVADLSDGGGSTGTRLLITERMQASIRSAFRFWAIFVGRPRFVGFFSKTARMHSLMRVARCFSRSFDVRGLISEKVRYFSATVIFIKLTRRERDRCLIYFENRGEVLYLDSRSYFGSLSLQL